MAKIARKTQKIFGATAGGTGITKFGSTAAGSTEYSTDIEEIMGTSAWSAGWLAAVLSGAKKKPTYMDENAQSYVFSTQLANLFQDGIPVYDSGTEYHIGCVVRKDTTTEIYKSIANTNTGNLLTNTEKWQYCGDLTELNRPLIYPGYVPYSVNSGNVDASGYADLIHKESNTEVSFNVGGIYPNMGITFPNGNHYIISSINNISSGLADNAIYTFVLFEENLTDNGDGTYSAIATAIKIGYTGGDITEDIKETESPVDGDLWLDLSQSPYKPYIWQNGVKIEKQFIKIGEVTKTGGTLGTPVSYAFNGKWSLTEAMWGNGQSQAKYHYLGTSSYALGIQLLCLSAEGSFVAGEQTNPLVHRTSEWLQAEDAVTKNKNMVDLYITTAGGSGWNIYDKGSSSGAMGYPTFAKWNIIWEAKRSF